MNNNNISAQYDSMDHLSEDDNKRHFYLTCHNYVGREGKESVKPENFARRWIKGIPLEQGWPMLTTKGRCVCVCVFTAAP